MPHTLKPHQNGMLQYALSHPRIGLLVHMRLGKSVVAVRWAESHGEQPLSLVVSYLSPIHGWVDELTREGLSSMLLVGPEEGWKEEFETAIDNGTRWFIINPERLIRSPWLLRLPWDNLLIDESTMIRNPQAKITKLLVDGKLKADGSKVFREYCPEVRRIKYKAILTGTPDPENPMDFCEQSRFLYGDFMGYHNWWDARSAMFNNLGYDWFPKPGTMEKIRKYIRERMYILTSKQAGVVFSKVRQIRHVELPEDMRKIYDKAEKEFTVGDVQTSWITVRDVWLAQIAGGLAMPEKYSSHKLVELVQCGKELRGQQIIVWFRFNEELREVANALRNDGESVVTVTGEDKPEVRQERRLSFQTGKARWFLAQAQCAKFGLDLSAASVMIWFSRWYEALPNLQAAERAFHLSKKETVLEIDLVTKNTIEEDLAFALQEKITSSAYFKQRIAESMKKRMEMKK